MLKYAVDLRPDHIETLYRHASVALALGDHAAADAGFAAGLARQPDFAPAHAGRGLALVGMGRLEDALGCFEKAIALDPAPADPHANRGLTFYRLGRHTEALEALEAALHRQPGHTHALANRGNVLRAMGRPDDALASFDAALLAAGVALDPRLSSVHTGRGATLQELHRYGDALGAHDHALALNPQDAEAHNNRGTALQALDHYADALAAYDRALTLRPDYADALANRAILLQMMGRATEAMAGFEAALAIRPLDSGLRFNASLCRLLLGDEAAGWRDFEHRWDSALMASERRDFPCPRWQGEATGTVLLHAEQGFGDTLQFCRYAPLVADRGIRVVLEVQPPLLRLMRRLDDRVTVIARGDPLPPVDAHCPLMSLPLVLGSPPILAAGVEIATSPDPFVSWPGERARERGLVRPSTNCPVGTKTWVAGPGPAMTQGESADLSLSSLAGWIPAPRGYLHADPGRVAAWRSRLGQWPDKKIGLVWAGSPRHHAPALRAADRRRSIALQQLAPLARPGFVFVSLQKGEAADQAQTSPPGMALLDWTAELGDFDDTAALVAALDLVISVDTAMVHLAGGLGVPVWVLNRFDTCWRWKLGRSDSPWYESATLFRQPAFGDWDSVIDATAAALEETYGQTV